MVHFLDASSTVRLEICCAGRREPTACTSYSDETLEACRPHIFGTNDLAGLLPLCSDLSEVRRQSLESSHASLLVFSPDL